MDDGALGRLADRFVLDTLKVQEGERVWLAHNGPKAGILVRAAAAAVLAAGGIPLPRDCGHEALESQLGGKDAEAIESWGRRELEFAKSTQAYLRVVDDDDLSKLALTQDEKAAWRKAMDPVTAHRIDNTRWLVTAAPTAEFAAACGMDLPSFERFYLDACLVDASAMAKAAEPLKALLRDGRTARVVSAAQDTDLSFSIEGVSAKACTGGRNLPDGECYTAPVLGSMEGTISFGPSMMFGESFNGVFLEFRGGRVVRARADDPGRTAALERILDTDEGARAVGEFAIAFNPMVSVPTGSILFDEKIRGSLHLALGRCYKEACNGNQSGVHWDLVQIQRPEYGGGEIWIDGRLVRKDGLFVVEELLDLNPDRLGAA